VGVQRTAGAACARAAPARVATAAVVTGLVPLFGFALFAPAFDGARVLAIALVPVACLQVAMLLAIELPDAAGDAATESGRSWYGSARVPRRGS